jgi:hypothetical protein
MVDPDPGYVNDTLQAILDYAYDCLENTTLGLPTYKFLSFTRPPNDCCDSLSVWFDAMLPTQEFPRVYDGVDKCGDIHRMMRVKLKLVRPCWPVLADNAANPFPPPSSIQEAAEALTIDSNVLWCCLGNGFATGDAWLDGNPSLLDTRIESLVPDEPRGGCAGFTMTIYVELDSCCHD